MPRRSRLRSAVAAIALVALGASGALAHGGPSATDIGDMFATVSGSAVDVTGTVHFGGQAPVVVGTDPDGDNLGAAATDPFGLDINALEIGQPSAEDPTLLFSIKLGQMVTGLPEGAQYNWDIMVDGGADEGGSNWSIKTMRTRAASTQTAGPYAGLFTCAPNETTGGFSCTQVQQLTGVAYETEESAIRIPVPPDAIGAGPGSTITAWARSTNPVWIGASAGGAQTITNVFDSATHDDYTVPAPPRVDVGLAVTGTDPETTAPAAVTGHDFNAVVTAPGSGTYDAVATACFATNCDTHRIPVTVE